MFDISQDRPGRYDDFLYCLTAVAAFLGGFLIIYMPFILGERNYFHDSLITATLYGLFYDRLFSGDSWLWSAALNGGHPLWVSFGAFPIVDPVALLVYPTAVVFGSNWFTAYYVTSLLWAVLWATGGALCAAWLTHNRWAALLVFVLLFSGPFSLSFPAESPGFLIPFRYFSLALYFYLRLRQKINMRSVFSFNIILALSLSSYTSVLLFVSFVSLAVAELLIDARGYYAWLKQICARRHIWFFLIPLLALAPTVAWFDYAHWLVSIPRVYARWKIHFLELDQITRDLIFTYLDALNLEVLYSVYHGTSFLGLFVIPFLILGLRRCVIQVPAAIGSGKSKSPSSHFSAVFVVWLALLLGISCGALGLRELVEARGSLFGFRNFGLLMPAIILLLTLLIAKGFADAMAKRVSWTDFVIDCVIFSIFSGVAYLAQEDKPASPEVLVALMAFVLLIAMLWRIMSIRYGTILFAVSVIVVVLIESLSFARLVPSLESEALFEEIEDPGGIVESRMPTFLSGRETLPKTRGFEFPAADHWPFHFDGPAVSHTASAFTEPVFETPIGWVGLAFTHFFRLPAYHDLVTKTDDRQDLEAILGVSRPILEIVPQTEIERAIDGLRLVTRSTAEDSNGPMATSEYTNTATAGVPSPAGEILDVMYFGSRVTVTLFAAEDTMLLYRDNMAPGWSVRVDGDVAELQIVDQVNKAVALAAGEHQVEFRYRPWSYLVTFMLRAVVLSLGGLACLGLWCRPRARVETS